MEEIWKDIYGYEGLYQVSNLGRIKSLKNNIILKQTKNTRGYLKINLYKCKKQKSFPVHRLVALAFIENENKSYKEINHKDENKENNCVNNLEWCDRKYNMNYGTSLERSAKKRSIKIEQYSMDGKLINIYENARIAEEKTGAKHSNISNCCNGKRKTTHGYIWKYSK